MFAWCGGEERPNVGDALLIGLRKNRQLLQLCRSISITILHNKLRGYWVEEESESGEGRWSAAYILELLHRGLVGLASALEVWPMPIAIFGGLCDDGTGRSVAERIVLSWDVTCEKGRHLLSA